MNLSYITNPVGVPVFTKEAIDQTTTKIGNAMAAVGNSSEYDTATQRTTIFVVTGTFVGKVKIYGKQSGTGSNIEYKKIIDLSSGAYIPLITAPGLYAVENEQCFTKMWGRLSAYTSGSVNIFALDGSDIPIQKAKVHQVQIASNLGVSVSASGSAAVISEVDISQFAFIYLVSRTDTAHAHTVGITFVHPYSIGSMAPENIIVTSSAQRDGETEWISVKGKTATVYVHNNDSSSHTYDVVLYGVT